MAKQPINAYLIYRIENGEKRVINTTWCEGEARESVRMLETAFYNIGMTGRTYGFEKNPKVAA